MVSWILNLPLLAVASAFLSSVNGATIKIGNDVHQELDIGWMDGACYLPIDNVRVGDILEFDYAEKGHHNVYQMSDWSAYARCDFRGSTLLGSRNESLVFYEVTATDPDELYFACRVGSHCAGGQQRVMVRVNKTATEARPEDPVSTFRLGASASACRLVQRGDADASLLERALESSCDEPVALEPTDEDDRPWMFTSCLSPPVTLTPGGVINQATVLHFPYPLDRRVVMGTRIWEFVQGSPDTSLEPVFVNQLYVHHILGGVVMGNGAESIRRSDEDAAFPPPYGRLSGDFSDVMTFHLIDLRGVGDEWLECVECRCKDVNGTYLNVGGAGEESEVNGNGESTEEDEENAGGISCCSNCTNLTTPTVDYRLRYNVTYMDIPTEEPYVKPIVMLSADIAPAVDRSIEFDVPQYADLPEHHQFEADTDTDRPPMIQELVRFGKIRDLFRHDFFADPYHGPDEIEIHRCTGHMHIGAVEMWLINARTKEIICHNKAIYGDNPAADQGFLTLLTVNNFEDAPIVVTADTRVRLITHYNASIVHTGVMGMFFLFVSEYETVTPDKAALKVDVCSSSSCNATLLPRAEDIPVCEDDLGFFCRFLDVCDCETFMEREEVIGGCGGVLMTARGNYSVDRFCAKTCGCKHLEREGAEEEMLQEGIEAAIKTQVQELCHYSTEGCHEYLNNLYACADDKPGAEVLDDFVRTMMAQQGRRMALDHAKLGNAAIHRFDAVVTDESTVPTCVEPPEPLESSVSRRSGFLPSLMMTIVGLGGLLLFN